MRAACHFAHFVFVLDQEVEDTQCKSHVHFVPKPTNQGIAERYRQKTPIDI
jgi:hypothetical protein